MLVAYIHASWEMPSKFKIYLKSYGTIPTLPTTSNSSIWNVPAVPNDHDGLLIANDPIFMDRIYHLKTIMTRWCSKIPSHWWISLSAGRWGDYYSETQFLDLSVPPARGLFPHRSSIIGDLSQPFKRSVLLLRDQCYWAGITCNSMALTDAFLKPSMTKDWH